MKLFKLSFAALMLTVAAIVTSCSSSSEKLTEQVPASTRGVMRVSADQWIESAGFSINSDGAIELSPEVRNTLPSDKATMLNLALSYAKGLDLSDILIYEYKSDFIGAMMLNDAEKVIKNVKALLGDPKEDGGYKVFDIDGTVLAIDGDMLFIAEDLKQIKNAREAASKENIASLPAIKEWMDAHKALSFAMPLKETGLPSQYASQWFCGAMEFDHSAVLGEMVLMNEDGKREAIGESFEEINTDFLRYVPAGQATLAGAIGNVQNTEFRSLLNSYASQMGPMKDLISSFDGTIAGALVIPDISKAAELTQLIDRGNIEMFRYMDFIVMAHYPQQVVRNTITMLSGESGIKPDSKGNLVIEASDDLKGYVSNVDGYLAISDYLPTGRAHNELNRYFEGRRAALVMVTDPVSGSDGFNVGMEASLWLETDALKGRMAFTGTDKPFLSVIIEALMQPGVDEALGQIYSQCFGGSYDDDLDYSYYPEDETEW